VSPASLAKPTGAKAARDEPQGFLGAMEIAKAFGVPKSKMGLLHQRLARFRKKHGNDPKYVLPVVAGGPRESRYLHSLVHVRPEIEDLFQPA